MPRVPKPSDLRERTLPIILQRLATGESMSAICASPDMPDRMTVRSWCKADPAIDEQVFEARETGFIDRGERAVQAAKTCDDPIKGRLAFDAERWFLGKMSRAFAERAPRIDNMTNVQVNFDGDGFGRIADLLDGHAARIAGGSERTALVVGDGEAGPGSP